MHRYLAMIWNPDSVEGARTSQSLKGVMTSRPTEWPTAYEGPGALVIHAAVATRATESYRLQNAGGVVLGRLFNRPGSGRESRQVNFDSGETTRIIDSSGQHLVDRYWGSYVAVLFDEAARRHHIFRDPIGEVPCYHASHEGVEIFFSHIEDCVRCFRLSFGVNRAYLTRWLVFSGLRTRQCGLDGIDEMPGGERITLSRGHISRALLWDPAQIASNPRLDSPDVAAKALRATVQETVDAWASCYQRITHKLSGGLDSSIVAACLAQAPSRPAIDYLNLSVDVGLDQERLHLPGVDLRTAEKVRAIAAHGDERHLARLVAKRWQTPLVERQRDVAMDLSRLWQAPLSLHPSMYFTVMEVDDIELEFAKSQGTQAFFSGQGGDSVFLATIQPFPAIDYAHLHGIRPGLWPHVLATARLNKDSVWSVLGKTIQHGVLHRRYQSPRSILEAPTLLRTELTSGLTSEDFENHLVASLAALPPGKQNHATGIHWAAYYDFVFYSGRYADHVDPLNSQPVWELMLQLPTYTILADGISRGLARRAFADVLPPEIRKRQAKGIGTPFYQQVVRRNRSLLRERLLDGLLVREGYLDRIKLDQYLAADEPFVTVSAAQVLSYLAAEIWLQQWSSAALDAAAPRASMASV